MVTLTAQSLGSESFRRDYNLKYAYMSGAMYKGISSVDLVVAMGQARLMGVLGTGGLGLETVERSLLEIRERLSLDQAFGMNLLSDPLRPDLEARTVDLYLKHDVRVVEASAYMQVSESLVRFRLKGIQGDPQKGIRVPRRVIAKVSRPEVAEAFMRPAPDKLLDKLVASGGLTQEEAALGRHVPVAQDICVEADSGGHTDQGVAYVLMPAMLSLRQRMMAEWGYAEPLRVGAAGGIGTPEAAAAAFILGADFIVTGSINQCTVEAGTSDTVKDMLQGINVQDTAYAPAGDMFEYGARVQVLKKGLLFPMRANKLYELYMNHDSIEQIDVKTRAQIEKRYFQRTFDDVWQETAAHYQRHHPDIYESACKIPKRKMALLFRWYFAHSTRLAMAGSEAQKVDYQVHCGPALGAFNQWICGTPLESWRQRHVADIAERIMDATAIMLGERLAVYSAGS